MRQLSAAGQKAVDDIAQRHGFSKAAVAEMLHALSDAHGSMAQFNHPEFGGHGQWMRGGMIMISDMFNNDLKRRVDSLCSELADLVARQPDAGSAGSFQSQSQDDGRRHGSATAQTQSGAAPESPSGLFADAHGRSGNWWPGDLGAPNSTGAQNDTRYAYFAGAHRLAIEVNGKVTVYDTRGHQIGGFSQQQSGSGSLTFTSQLGPVDVASLPVVAANATASREPAAAEAQDTSKHDVFAAIEKLAALHGKGVLTDAEFNAKKAELLARL